MASLIKTLPLHLRSLPTRTFPFRRFAAALSTLHPSPSLPDNNNTSASSTDPAPSSPTRTTVQGPTRPTPLRTSNPPPNSRPNNTSDDRPLKDVEEDILNDILPLTFLIKEVIHSDRYMDGERLTDDDQNEILKLLAYHPHAENKVGCGLESLMVNRHPTFNSRCLFAVRIDGSWIDFSYQKCLRAYIQEKYPAHAERFIRKHLKRT